MPQEMLFELNTLPIPGLKCCSKTRDTGANYICKVVLRELGSPSQQQLGKLAHFYILLSSHIAGFGASLTRLKPCHYPSTVHDSLVARQCCSTLSWARQKLCLWQGLTCKRKTTVHTAQQVLTTAPQPYYCQMHREDVFQKCFELTSKQKQTLYRAFTRKRCTFN